MIHTHHVQMRWSDIDSMGHLNHARLVSYLEDARVGLFEELAAAIHGMPGVILAHIEVDYLRPVMYSREPVEVDVWLSHMGAKSFTLAQEVRQDGQPVARASTVLVAFDYATQATRAISDNERAALRNWERESDVRSQSAG